MLVCEWYFVVKLCLVAEKMEQNCKERNIIRGKFFFWGKLMKIYEVRLGSSSLFLSGDLGLKLGKWERYYKF